MLAMAVVFGLVDAASRPAGYTILVDIVGTSRLVVANALDQVAEFGGELIAPLLVGVIIASAGSAPLFYFARAVLLVGALLMALVRATPPREVVAGFEERAGVLAEIRAGLAYTLGAPPFPALLGVSALSLLAAAVFPLVPFYARDVLEVGPRGFGLMTAALAAGMLTGALGMAALGDVRRPGVMRLLSRAVWFAAMAAFAVSQAFVLSLALLAVMGASGAVAGNLVITQFQRYAEDRVRVRVMSVHRMAESFDPLSAVVGGALASLFGAEAALLLCAGGGAFALAVIALASPSLRRG
ncbi:MAG: MFS transporter [Dehalococcoidia bacterium]|nr:MFS transporter [Dehalococcoidia bacterium]